MAKNIIFMTAMVDAPDVLNYAEWCYNSWDYWCKKNDVQLFILEDELRPKGDGTYKVPGMKPTWQRWHVFDVLDANEIEYDNVALVDIDTMVHWDAPNFFEEANGEFGAVKDKFNIDVESFSYPYGKYNKNVIQFVKKYYRFAVTTKRSRFKFNKFDLLEIPRIPVNPDTSMFKFYLKIKTIYEDIKYIH